MDITLSSIMSVLVAKDLLDMEKASFHAIVDTNRYDVSWLQANVDHHGQFEMNMNDVQRRRYNFLDMHLESATEARALPSKQDIDKNDGRVAAIDFGIEDTSMVHTFDLNKFEERVDSLFHWMESKFKR
jgi:hypothetical protein